MVYFPSKLSFLEKGYPTIVLHSFLHGLTLRKQHVCQHQRILKTSPMSDLRILDQNIVNYHLNWIFYKLPSFCNY